MAKAITLVITVGIVLALIFSAGQKGKSSTDGSIETTKLNEQYQDIKNSLKAVIYDAQTLKKEAKDKKKKEKVDKKNKDDNKPYKKRLYLLDFDGDIKASAVDSFREEITAVLSLATEQDEVLVRL